mmetsp:Transcript_36847/g.112745  ORF Transcript_36847/g.112745 Transcript_36847/m.112745 type:complete len:201 (+) Transcript_36847:1822-2424(+)
MDKSRARVEELGSLLLVRRGGAMAAATHVTPWRRGSVETRVGPADRAVVKPRLTRGASLEISCRSVTRWDEGLRRGASHLGCWYPWHSRTRLDRRASASRRRRCATSRVHQPDAPRERSAAREPVAARRLCGPPRARRTVPESDGRRRRSFARADAGRVPRRGAQTNRALRAGGAGSRVRAHAGGALLVRAVPTRVRPVG